MTIMVPLSLFYVRSAILNTFDHSCHLPCFWAPHRPVTGFRHNSRTPQVHPDQTKQSRGWHPWRGWVSSGLSLCPSSASAWLSENWGTPLNLHVVCCPHWHLFMFSFISLDLAHPINLFHSISSPNVFLALHYIYKHDWHTIMCTSMPLIKAKGNTCQVQTEAYGHIQNLC